MASSYDVTIKLYSSRVESVMRAVNAMNVGEKIIELNNKHQFKKNKQVKKGCAKVKEKVEILISFE